MTRQNLICLFHVFFSVKRNALTIFFAFLFLFARYILSVSLSFSVLLQIIILANSGKQRRNSLSIGSTFRRYIPSYYGYVCLFGRYSTFPLVLSFESNIKAPAFFFLFFSFFYAIFSLRTLVHVQRFCNLGNKSESFESTLFM